MTFAQRKPLPRPEAGQTIFSGREKEIGLYRLHYHRPKDQPQVRLITAISGPGGAGKTRLLDELEWYRPAETIYCRIDDSTGFGHDATRLMRAIADGLHRAGEPIPTPQFDRLFKRRQALLEKALTRSTDPKQVLRHFYRPVLLGLGPAPPPFNPDLDSFANLNWSEADFDLAFGNPIGLMTRALVADLRTDKVVLIFDHFERIHPVVGEWLLSYLLGQAREAITCDLRLVVAGRDELLTTDERWQPWSDTILTLSLQPFTPAEMADFSQKNSHLTDPAAVERVGQATGRSPLWLNVWVMSGAAPEAPDLGQALAEPQKSWLEKAALAGSFDQQRLTTLVGDEEGRAAFKWLIGQQTLVRASSAPGQFVLDRTLGETLLREAEVELVPLKQQLLDYLDGQLALLRTELLGATRLRMQADYQAIILERLRHTLSPLWDGDAAPDAAIFLRASFINALNEYPPLMFDLLALAGGLGSRGAGEPGSRGAGEQRSRGAGEQRSRGAGGQGGRGAGEQEGRGAGEPGSGGAA